MSYFDVCKCFVGFRAMARPFENICDISNKKELWKIDIKVHHKWNVVYNNKEHVKLIFIDVDVGNR